MQFTSTQLDNRIGSFQYTYPCSERAAPLRLPSLPDVLHQLPPHVHSKLVAALTEGDDASWGCKQPFLAAARLTCKTLRDVVDQHVEGLHLNTLPDHAQGPAPSLARFPNAHSVTVALNVEFGRSCGQISGELLLPDEQPEPSARLLRADAAAPPPGPAAGGAAGPARGLPAPHPQAAHYWSADMLPVLMRAAVPDVPGRGV